jgi:hypothetical protein
MLPTINHIGQIRVTSPRRAPRKVLFLALAALEGVVSTTSLAASTAPLIKASDIAYLGAFALPSWANGATYGTSYFEYGGHAVTPYHDPVTGKRTLFMEGHAQHPGNIAEVEIPASFVKSTNWSALPIANVLQPFVSVPSNPDPASCVGNPAFVYGMLGYGGRLLIGAACSYGGAQTTSHGVRSLNLSTAGFQGFYAFTGTVAPPRALGGQMTTIPSEWQTAFGGPVFTGTCCISVIGSTSAGPSLTVFDPARIGVTTPLPGKTVLFYPLSNPVCGAEHCEATQNNTYNLTTVYGGVAFPPGSSSILFVTAHGTGPYCYGSASDCGNDPYLPDVKGPHAQPYRYQILAYDANDLVAVKNGMKQTWEPTPYATIVLNGMPFSNDDKIKGAGYDPETGRLYITQDYGTTPRVEVYQITVPGTGSSTSLSPPTNVRVTG